MESEQVLAPEDILSSSLGSLYDYQPITLSSAGSELVYTIENDQTSFSTTITLHTPDTHPANWYLHASSIWASSAFLTDHLSDLHIHEHAHSYNGKVRILELGAGAGLPSIALAKSYEDVLVTASDYPDQELIQTLTDNVERNGVSERCQVVAYAWGTDPSILLKGGDHDGFEIIMAGDTIWNPESHSILVSTFLMTLRRSSTARVYLIAGLHTGRYTVQSFYETVQKMGLEIESATEREVIGTGQRDWDVTHAEGEDERERRKWIIWMALKWPC